MREVTPEDRDRLCKSITQSTDEKWALWANSTHTDRSLWIEKWRAAADRIIADGWRLLPTRSELRAKKWKVSVIDGMIADGFAREDPDGN